MACFPTPQSSKPRSPLSSINVLKCYHPLHRGPALPQLCSIHSLVPYLSYSLPYTTSSTTLENPPHHHHPVTVPLALSPYHTYLRSSGTQMAASPSDDISTIKSSCWSSLGLLATVAILPDSTRALGHGVDMSKVNGRIRPPTFRKSCSRAQYREQRHRARKTAKDRGEPLPHYSGYTDSENNESDNDPVAPPDSAQRANE
jgi:hypothetical protein